MWIYHLEFRRIAREYLRIESISDHCHFDAVFLINCKFRFCRVSIKFVIVCWNFAMRWMWARFFCFLLIELSTVPIDMRVMTTLNIVPTIISLNKSIFINDECALFFKIFSIKSFTCFKASDQQMLHRKWRIFSPASAISNICFFL